jgi:3-oxoacid CoA-transferase subunit B
MEHVAKDGSYKIVNECSLPYTGRSVVQRIITDLAVIDVLAPSDGGGLRLRELAPGVSFERSLRRPNPKSWAPAPSQVLVKSRPSC